jgi:ADP-ribose pyrophosphatase YjhB (NUDIX family)
MPRSTKQGRDDRAASSVMLKTARAAYASSIGSSAKQHYVLGFIFNEAGTRVLLTLKNRPKLLAGQWNGIGGKFEPREFAHKTIKRECFEETGLMGLDWRCFAVMNTADNGVMWCYSVFTSRIDNAEQQPGETEPLATWNISDLPFKKPALRHNVPWMVHMAICHRMHPRYAFKVEEMHK